MSGTTPVNRCVETISRVRERSEFRQRKRRSTSGVIALWIAPAIALLFLVSTASAATLGAGAQSYGAQTVVSPGSIVGFVSNGNASGGGVTPDANTVVNVFNEIGYNGNATVYPTNDTSSITTGTSVGGTVSPVSLPVLSHESWQTASNSSLGTSYGAPANVNFLNVSTIPQEYPRYYNIGSGGNNFFYVQVWVVSTGLSAQFDVYPNGCNDQANEALVGADNIAVSSTGLPSGNTGEVVLGNDTGTNVTIGNLMANGSGDLKPLVGVVLAVVAVALPELALGLAIASVALALSDTEGSGGSSSFYGNNSNTLVSGNTPFNQLEVTKGGNVSTSCAGVGSKDGQNAFTQADLIQEWLPYPGSNTGHAVTPGSIRISAYNDLVFDDTYSPSSSFAVAGASPSISYPLEPAVSVGGVVHLWAGGPVVSPAPKAATNIVIQQQYTGTTFQSNYENPNPTNGYYHVFLEPNVEYTQLNAYLEDKMGETDTNLGELPTGDWTEQGSDVEHVDVNLTGGQLNGTVEGLPAIGSEGPVAGAAVQLCNTQGCISTTTNSAGKYALQFPVAGTISDPDELTITATGWNTSVAAYELPVDKYTQENTVLRPAGGGGCVAKGTPILTPSGYVAVQNLQQGQSILEFDFATQSFVYGEFISANVTAVDAVVNINHGLLYLTPTDQPIYIQNATFTGWLRDPQNLSTADSVYNPVTLSWIHLTSLSTVYRQVNVYDVVTGGFDNFVANGVLLDPKG
jgi:hypothetical protein